MSELMTETEWLDIFGTNLKEMMREQGYTQDELAIDTGLSKGAINNYINKRRIPGIKAIINLSYVLNCDFSDLIDFGSRIE